MKWKPCLSLCLWSLLLIAASFAEAVDFRFTAEVDKPRLSFDDVAVLSFVISGENIGNNLRPELPDLTQDFDILRGPIQSHRTSIIHGNATTSITYQYVLSPKRTGTLEIGAASVEYDGTTYTTDPITIEVTNTTPPPSQSPSQGTSSQQSGDQNTRQPEVFLRAEADKDTLYIGEQLTVSFFLYTQVNVSGYEITQQSSFTGFWVEDLQIPTPPKLQYTTLNGQRYGVALMKKVALFPTLSGEMSIDPLVMTLSVRTRDRTRPRDPFDRFFDDPFFGRTQEIIRKTQPLEVTILPLPEENRPETFTGDVGNFTMSATLDPTEVTQEEPVTLTVKIQGTGNIKTVKEPVITLPESFKRYDTEISEHLFPLQEPMQGEKIFNTVLIPLDAGQYQLEPVQFSFFDPQRQAYQTLTSEPLTLTILPNVGEEAPMERRITTKAEIKLLGQDIRFIKTDVPALVDQGDSWYQHRWFHALLLLPMLLIAAAYGYKRYRAKYTRDERYVRQKRANKLSQKRLQAAAELMQQCEVKAFYAAISSTLRQYLGDKLNLPAAGITGAEISQILQEAGLDQDTVHLLHECLEQCDFARFAPVEADQPTMRTTLRQAETLIDRIERLKTLRTSSLAQHVNSATLFLMLLLGSLLLICSSPTASAEMSVEELFRQGNTLYEEGHYMQAIARYQEILATGLENGYVYYNLGNALFKANRLGEAIVQYERAKRLLPRDDDVAFNLDYARALTLDKMEQARGRLTQMLTAVRTFFSPNEVSLVLWIAYLMLTFCIITAMFVPRRWKLRLIYVAILPTVVVVGTTVLLVLQISHRTVDEAILLAPQVEAKTGPGEAYSTIFEIHEGAKVRIQREKLDWVEIQLPNHVIGWVMKKDLARIDRHS
ncbi:tetratricopeptide repeat protein [candidate division KSB3 bacterium]|uniref:Tetratricopeptide repeat protein n=1 Tax=candidate division KSB3 bacterium TaxID=2044937 RepID=A0A9D5K0Y9_9BACT|nr:tetratricopeptide repeat protein [candidate division KSB3 bacterium]MBD3327651.1 tetratricopeptide repeat protein [candidate division KSB3 bacterium]